MTEPGLNTNPYQSNYSHSPADVTSNLSSIHDSLSSLAKWQTYFAVLGLLASLGAIGVMGFQLIVLSGLDNSGIVEGLAAFAIVAVLVGLFYIVPTVKLFKAASSARAYAANQSGSMESLLQRQVSFWRYLGIMVSVVLGIYLMIVLVALLFGIASSM